MPILADYHMHTPRCKHALGPMEGYIENGIAIGLRKIGFADHNPLPNGWGANVRMDEVELDDYVADVLRLRERHRGAIEVRLGLEADYVEGLEDYIAKQRDRHLWDYVIGSVHYLDAECQTMSWQRNYAGDMSGIWTRYYELARKLAATGSYDIVAHFDLPKRTGRPATEREDEAAELTLQKLSQTGMCMEINMSPPPCWRPCGASRKSNCLSGREQNETAWGNKMRPGLPLPVRAESCRPPRQALRRPSEARPTKRRARRAALALTATLKNFSSPNASPSHSSTRR